MYLKNRVLTLLALYAGVLHSLAGIFSSWPHSDFTPLSHLVTCTFLASPFLHQRYLLE